LIQDFATAAIPEIGGGQLVLVDKNFLAMECFGLPVHK